MFRYGHETWQEEEQVQLNQLRIEQRDLEERCSGLTKTGGLEVVYSVSMQIPRSRAVRPPLNTAVSKCSLISQHRYV